LKVTVFGSGYVGLVQAAVLAEVGHTVCCVDVDERRVEQLKGGVVPIYEPGLEALMVRNSEMGNLRFTTEADDGVAHGDVVFIAVGTPSKEGGAADLSYVLDVAGTIARLMLSDKVVVVKSTVPVGTAEQLRSIISEKLLERNKQLHFDVVSNPEFLKEGSAVSDCMMPDRIILGSQNSGSVATLRELYSSFNRNHDRILTMDTRSAELTKYAANCFLATKISFMNEMANMAEHLGADVESVRQGIGLDPRIGTHFIYAGCGYGGSCFPKDVGALIAKGQEVGFDASILRAVENVNHKQKSKLFTRIKLHYEKLGQDLSGKVIALWGLAFKPNTDDMREAPSLYLMEALWASGAKVQAYDPQAMAECERRYPAEPGLMLMDGKEAALQGADALVICTEWKNFWVFEADLIHSYVKDRVIFDGRNLYDPVQVSAQGIVYYGIGRGASSLLP